MQQLAFRQRIGCAPTELTHKSTPCRFAASTAYTQLFNQVIVLQGKTDYRQNLGHQVKRANTIQAAKGIACQVAQIGIIALVSYSTRLRSPDKVSLKLGVVMDPIESINPKKDSTLAMLLAAQKRGWEVHYMLQRDLFSQNGTVFGRTTRLSVQDDLECWFEKGEETTMELADLDAILMRKDPPFDMEYIYTTYLLEQAEQKGTLVVNRPSALRDINEKFSTTWFPDCCPEHIVTRDPKEVRKFLAMMSDIVIKPLDGMGGESIFRIREGDPNTGVILETLLGKGDTETTAIAQRFLPEYKQGDKRILLIDGDPVPYALARIPAEGEGRANLAAGGTGVGVELTERDRKICARLAPELNRRGVLFAGIDVIGDYLTEINITSPTCIRELDQQFGLDIGGDLMAAIEKVIQAKKATANSPSVQ